MGETGGMPNNSVFCVRNDRQDWNSLEDLSEASTVYTAVKKNLNMDTMNIIYQNKKDKSDHVYIYFIYYLYTFF